MLPNRALETVVLWYSVTKLLGFLLISAGHLTTCLLCGVMGYPFTRSTGNGLGQLWYSSACTQAFREPIFLHVPLHCRYTAELVAGLAVWRCA